jgi:hypothetical protein
MAALRLHGRSLKHRASPFLWQQFPRQKTNLA